MDIPDCTGQSLKKGSREVLARLLGDMQILIPSPAEMLVCMGCENNPSVDGSQRVGRCSGGGWKHWL